MNDAFNYLSVLLSIIIGLGMTQILTAMGRLIRHRAVVKFYWVPVLWAEVLLVVYVQSWWSMFGLRGHAEWHFLDFLVVLLQTVTLYMVAALVLPESVDGDVVDLRAHYRTQRRWFFGFFLATLVVSVIKDYVLSGALPSAVNLGFHALFGTMTIIALSTRRDRVHEVLAIITAGTFAGYIAILFATLR